MEQSVVTTRGIIIEKLTIGWLQLLIAAFSIGGISYLGLNGYTILMDVKLKQEAALEKYVPIITRIDSESIRYNSTLHKLDNTLSTLNQNLAAITLLREREEDDRREFKKEFNELRDTVIDIQIALSLQNNQHTSKEGKGVK